MFKIDRKALLAELALLQLVAEKKGTIPALAYLRFDLSGEMLSIVGTDQDTWLTTTIPATGEPWIGCLHSKQLYELVRLLSDETLEFTPKDNGRVQIGRGNSNHKLSTISADKFPVLDTMATETTTVDGAAVRLAMERAVACVETGTTNQLWMQGVAFRSMDGYLHVAGTNSAQFAVSQIVSEIHADCIIPAKAMQAISKVIGEGELGIGFTENHAVFQQGQRRIVARLLDAKFPDWQRFIPESFTHRITLDPATSQLAFRRACVLTEQAGLDVRRPVRLSISKSELTIKSRENEHGQSTEVVPIDCATLNGDTLERGVNGLHFINFLDPDSKPFMVFNDDLFLFQLGYEDEPAYRYITMPLKV